MYLINYKFYSNNIIRGILLRKYCVTNCFSITDLNRVIITLELKDKEDNVSTENFMALNILFYISKNKSSCIKHSSRYKFGQKHTFVFQSILRGNSLYNFLTQFNLNNLLLLKKKQTDVNLFFNDKVINLLMVPKDISFFSQIPVEFFKWNVNVKVEFALLGNTFKFKDLFSFINNLTNSSDNNLLQKSLFYNAIFKYKR